MSGLSWLTFAIKAGVKKPLEYFIIGFLLTASWNMVIHGSPELSLQTMSRPQTKPATDPLQPSITNDVISPSLPQASLEVPCSATISTESETKIETHVILNWTIRLISFIAFAALLIGVFRYFDGLSRHDDLSIGIVLSGFSPLLESAIALFLFALITVLPGYLILQVAQMLHESAAWFVALPFYCASLAAYVALTASHIFFFCYLADGRRKPVQALQAARRRALKQPLQALTVAIASLAIIWIGASIGQIAMFAAWPVACSAIAAALYSRNNESIAPFGGISSESDPTDWRAATHYRPPTAD